MTAAAAHSLFWIALGSLVIPLISRRLNIPSAVGELIYGIICGPYLLDLLAPDQFIEIMAELGFAILMFGAGMEIDFGPLRKRGTGLIFITGVWVVLVIELAVAGGRLLGFAPWPVLAACSVSIGLASVMLRERKLLAAPLGQVILTAGLIGESLSIMIWTILDIHERIGFSREFFLELTQFTGIFVLAYLLMRVFRFIIWLYPKRVAGFLESGDPLELGVRLAVALIFIFIAAASILGVEAILGTFVAGAMFSFIFQERKVIEDKINTLGQGFFVPFFFIVVGSHFDPWAAWVAISWGDLGQLLLLALTVKLLPSLIFFRLGLKAREVLAAGLLMSAPLTLTVAIAEVADRLHVISPGFHGNLILLAILLGLACPFLARLVLSGPPVETGK